MIEVLLSAALLTVMRAACAAARGRHRRSEA